MNETIYRQQAEQFHKKVRGVLSDLGGDFVSDSKEGMFVNQAITLLTDDQRKKIGKELFKVFANIVHPDHGGSDEKMQTLNNLKDEMMK